MLKRTDDIELKAWRRLAELRGLLLSSIRYKAQNTIEYQNKPDEILEQMRRFASEYQWRKHGLIRETDAAELLLLEYLLNDNESEVRSFKDWQPVQR